MTPDEMAPDTGTAASSATRLDYLEKLGDELRRLGLSARLSVPRDGAPSLHVMNPEASALSENILAERGADGWWFWWSWAERIASADDVGAAAARVALGGPVTDGARAAAADRGGGVAGKRTAGVTRLLE